jgi:tetratricopeptide (TPR) repeat protein
VFAVVLYANLGTPQSSVRSGATPPENAQQLNTRMRQSQTGQLASVGDMVTGLEKRLASSPEDAGGWLLLAKSYQHLERPDDARQAYEKAAALGSSDSQVEAYLAGQTGDQSSAHTSIQGRVELADGAADGLDGAATVFIIARNADGPQTPLAVLRTPVSTLPFDFTLHDGLAMVAGNDLSSAERVIVTAKVSATGDALSTLPGFETRSAPVMTDSPEYVTLALGQ